MHAMGGLRECQTYRIREQQTRGLVGANVFAKGAEHSTHSHESRGPLREYIRSYRGW